MKLAEQIQLSDQTILQQQKILRYLPKRRAVILANWQEQSVVAKLFWGIKAKEQLRRNVSGCEYLAKANILSPKILYQGMNNSADTAVILFEYLLQGKLLDENVLRGETNAAEQLANTLAQLHQAKLRQKDLHLSNFLLAPEGMYVLDAASITHYKKALSQKTCFNDVIELMLQLPSQVKEVQDKILHSYLQAQDWQFDQQQKEIFDKQYQKIKQQKIKRHVKRSMRNTTRNVCLKSSKQFLICQRDCYDQTMQDFLQNIDQFLQKAVLLAKTRKQKIYRVQIQDEIYQVNCFRQKFFASRKWLEVQAEQNPKLQPIAFLVKRTAWIFNRGNYIVFREPRG